MQPMQLEKKEIRFHVIAWLCWIIIQSLLYPFRGPSLVLYIVSPIQYFLAYLVVFYSIALWILPQFWPRKIGGLIVSLAILFAGFVLFRILMFYVVLPSLDENFVFDRSFPYKVFAIVSFYWFLLYGFLAATYFAVKRNLTHLQRKRALEKSLMEAEYAFLKAQFNPHFLFNTLSYMYTKAAPVSQDLADAVMLLSRLMRYSLQKADRDHQVSLQAELDYLQDFIDLHQLRLDQQLYVQQEIQGDVSTQRIIPLLLVSLVENAFKHGKLHDPDYPLFIGTNASPNKVTFTVSNQKNTTRKVNSYGIGHQNLLRRLELAYPGRYQLDIQDDTKGYLCQLTISKSTPNKPQPYERKDTHLARIHE